MNLFGYMVDLAIIWIIVAVIFAVIEAVTLGLLTIWFTVGAVLACIADLLGAPPLLQVIVFLVSSILLLYFTKPIAKKKLKIGSVATNVDALVGQVGVVTEDIIPHYTGQVKLGGQIWTAIADRKETTIVKGTEVRILRVEGVKLVVVALPS